MRMSLNSACYRTLVRIFSLCLDEQNPAPNPHPNPSVDSDPNGNSPNLEQPSESIHGPKPNGSSTIVNESAHFQIKEGATLVENLQTSTRQSESTHGSNPNSCLNRDANGNSKSGNELGHYRIENAVALVENCQNSAQQSQFIHSQNPNPSLNCDPDGSSKLGDELSHCQVDNKKGTSLAENSPQLEEELRARKWEEEERLRAYSGINNGENLKNLTNAEKEVSSRTEEVEVRVKKKRGPQTERRKAQKKIAKKRKRAQKEREQGVKRLKLQPIVKPKEVKYCNFYLVGRCQQGDLCKFSHDMTPLTKSQPCKHFACDSCLKGDDCPYDHQLSKYPCHNYMSKGECIRGDNCKFSHKLPVTEGSTPTSVTCSADSIVPTKNSNFLKQLPMNRTKASSLQFVLHKPSTENLVNASKEPMHVPNGIRFNKKPSAAGADRREALRTECYELGSEIDHRCNK